jgi:hypothetical protein
MLFGIYLNDHLAAATSGRELARRAAANNRTSEYGPFLGRLAYEISQDRQSLVAIMQALGVRADPLKVAIGWGAEKVGRLKLNGRLLGYSPLSRVVELEGLAIGVYAKMDLWRSLQQLAPERLASAGASLSDLIERAERQLEELEHYRRRAMTEVLASG